MDSSTCESCGAPTRGADLSKVHRAYFFDSEDPAPEVQKEEEFWCAGCRETYPNVDCSEAGVVSSEEPR